MNQLSQFIGTKLPEKHGRLSDLIDHAIEWSMPLSSASTKWR